LGKKGTTLFLKKSLKKVGKRKESLSEKEKEATFKKKKKGKGEFLIEINKERDSTLWEKGGKKKRSGKTLPLDEI